MVTASSNAARVLIQGFFERHPQEAARALSPLPVSEILRLLQAEPISRATALFVRLDPDVAVGAIEQMEDGFFRDLFTEMDTSPGAALLARMGNETATRQLALLPSHIARDYREIMDYPPESAGALMDAQVTTFRVEETVEEALMRIRNVRQRRILDLCVVDEAGNLVSVVPLQEVAISDPGDRLGDLRQGKPFSIPATSSKEEVVELLETRKLASIPVVDFEGRLLGIIRYDALIVAAQEDASGDIQAMVGAGREERALSRASFAIRKRLPWLQINLGTAFLASFVVGLFEDTIARFTALAILLPVVAGQSGNTGAQALAVTMRGLAMREIRVSHWLRVMWKEAGVGFVNGCAVALTTSLAVYVFMGPGLALVIGVAMVVSMVSAGLSGVCIPVLLTAIKQDPAQSASIILTTITDVVGFLSFLGLATVLSRFFGLML